MKTKLLFFAAVLCCAVTSTSFAQDLSQKRKELTKHYNTLIDSIQHVIDNNNTAVVPPVLGNGEPNNIQISNFLLYDKIRKLKNEETLTYRKDELEALLSRAKDSLMVTGSNYNKIVQNRFRNLSGTEIKNGKFFGTSVTVDSKSVTVNGSVKLSKYHEFYLQPSLAGTSKDGFTTVITGNKYSKTITGGLNFIALDGNNWSKFNNATASRLHNDLQVLRYDYNKVQHSKDSLFFQDNFRTIGSALIDQATAAFIESYLNGNVAPADMTPANLKSLEDYKKSADTLIKTKLLPKNFDQLPLIYKKRLIQQHTVADIENLCLSKYLDNADKIQQKASFTSESIHWYSGGLKYNVANYNIQDASSKKLTGNYADEYFTLTLAYTWMQLYASGSHFYISPTFSIQDPHNFNSDNQIHAQVFQDYPIGATTTQRVTKDVNFYPSIPGRLYTNYILLPIAYFYTKWGIGAELDFKYGHNDVMNDNVNAALGILIPIQSDKSVIIVEPVLKAQKLNQKVTGFWSNNAVFGITVTVAIPKAFFSKS